MINEQVIAFEMLPFNVISETEIEIEGSQLVALSVNGQNVTFTFNPLCTEPPPTCTPPVPVSNNKLTLNATANIIAYLPQNVDTEFATHGRSLEGDFINNFTKLQREHVLGWVEHFNIPQSVQDQLFDSALIDGQKTYEIAGKMKLGFFGNDPSTISAGTAYVKAVNGSTTFLEIFDKLEEEVSLATGRNDTGNVPNAGKEPEDD